MKDKQLARILSHVHQDDRYMDYVKRLLKGILISLGMKPEAVNNWIADELDGLGTIGASSSNNSLYEVEQYLYDSLNEYNGGIIYKNLGQMMKARAEKWYEKIQYHLNNVKTLDLGGGSGELANLMQVNGNNVTIADALQWSRYSLPFVPVVNNIVSAKDKTYEQVVVLTVFHHSDDVPALVREAFRLAQRRVIIIESVTNDFLGYVYGCYIDWFYNRIIHFSPDPEKMINVPCNFLSVTGWEQLIWKETGYTPDVSESLGIFQDLNPENHHMFIYEF